MGIISEALGINDNKNKKKFISKYVITGKDFRGKRFAPIYTDTPQHYIIAEGSLFEIKNGKRKLVRRYFKY